MSQRIVCGSPRSTRSRLYRVALARRGQVAQPHAQLRVGHQAATVRGARYADGAEARRSLTP